jgi:hypothetical protein
MRKSAPYRRYNYRRTEKSAPPVPPAAVATSGTTDIADKPKAAPPKVKKTRKRQEDKLQRAVFKFLAAAKRRDVLCFHVPNGGYRTTVEGALLKGLGVVAGIPDVLCVYQGRLFALELKTLDGVLSDAQKETQQLLRAAGAEVATTYGLDAAVQQLFAWGLIRANSVSVTSSRIEWSIR